MIDGASLRLRLTIAYAACAFAVLAIGGFVLAGALFTVVMRPDSAAVERSVRIVEREISHAPAGEPLEVAQSRVIAAAAERGIDVIAVPASVFHHDGGGPPGYLELGIFFNFTPKFIPIRDGAVAVIPGDRERRRATVAFEALFGLVTLLSAAGAWTIARFGTEETMRPLLTVTAELERFARGDFAPRRLRLSETDEIARLATAYNAAADSVTQAFVERRGVEDRMRRFVADAGRELRTPLAAMTHRIDALRRDDAGDADVRRTGFDSVATEVRRMRTVVESLMKLARLDGLYQRETEVVDVAAIAREAIRSVPATAAAPVAFEASPGVRVVGEPADVYEAIEALLDNALAYGAGTRVHVTVSADRGSATVRVRDGGPGIAPPDREQIFESFYRGDRDRADVPGFGLGLAIASKAAERLGGRVELEDPRAGSTTFALSIPLLRANGGAIADA